MLLSTVFHVPHLSKVSIHHSRHTAIVFTISSRAPPAGGTYVGITILYPASPETEESVHLWSTNPLARQLLPRHPCLYRFAVITRKHI